MGNFSSKTATQGPACVENDEQALHEGDPRSPSIDINRTPLQQNEISIKPVTKNIDLNKECFDKYDEKMINPAIRDIMNDVDPRSPTLDFQRTPLAFMIKNPEMLIAHNNLNTSCILNDSQISEDLNASNTGVITKIEPKNIYQDLNNLSISVQNNSVNVTPEKEIVNQSVCEEANCQDVGKEMLETTEAVPSPNQPIAGLLETNLDYIETDLDTVRRCKYIKVKKETSTKVSPSKVSVDVTPAKDLIIEKDLSNKDPRSPSDEIDRTPILLTESKSNIIESKSTKSLNNHMKEIFKQNLKLQQKKLARELNKKNVVDALLIYEDVQIDEYAAQNVKNPAKSQSDGVRTPLGCMMNIEHPNSKQNTPIENVYDLNTKTNSIKSGTMKSKIPVRVSKISPNCEINTKTGMHNCPSKTSELSVKSRRLINMDAENTPPKPRKACWDQDNSVIL